MQVEYAKPCVDDKAPRFYSHMVVTSSTISKEKEELDRISKENKILLSKINYVNRTGVKEGFGNQINLCRDRGLNPGPPAQKSDTLPPRPPGVLSMANTANTNSVFNITFKELQTLDGKCVVIGKVIKGLQTLNKVEEAMPCVDNKAPRLNVDAFLKMKNNINNNLVLKSIVLENKKLLQRINIINRTHVEEAMPCVDNKAPRLNVDAFLKMKNNINNNLVLKSIVLENKKLLQRINIINRTHRMIDYDTPNTCMDFNYENRLKKVKTITKKNYDIIKRIVEQIHPPRWCSRLTRLSCRALLLRTGILRFESRSGSGIQLQYASSGVRLSEEPTILEVIFEISLQCSETGREEASHTSILANEPGPTKSRDALQEESVDCLSVYRSNSCFLDVKAEDGFPLGRMIVELYSDRVPKTALNFLSLCKGDSGWSYRNSPFHCILPPLLCQAGDVVRFDGHGGTSIYGDTFPDENFDLKHVGPGILSMVSVGTNTNNSKFNISFKQIVTLNNKCVVFGRLVKGFKTLRKYLGSDPHLRRSVENYLGKTTPSLPNRDSKLNLPVLDRLAQHKTIASANYATEAVFCKNSKIWLNSGSSKPIIKFATIAREAKTVEDSREAKHEENSREAKHGEDSREVKPGEDSREAKSGEDSREAKPGEDSRKAKPGEDSREAKPGEDLSEAKPGEDSREAKPGEDSKEAKPGEDSREAKPGKDSREAKHEENSREAKHGEDSREVKPGEDSREAKPGEDSREAKPGEDSRETKPGEDSREAKTGEDSIDNPFGTFPDSSLSTGSEEGGTNISAEGDNTCSSSVILSSNFIDSSGFSKLPSVDTFRELVNPFGSEVEVAICEFGELAIVDTDSLSALDSFVLDNPNLKSNERHLIETPLDFLSTASLSLSALRLFLHGCLLQGAGTGSVCISMSLGVVDRGNDREPRFIFTEDLPISLNASSMSSLERGRDR
uniref:(California timema) hypothetical protein n=1 Tax=Timema californicum TaxID=61474 RepID=A0A7R9J5R4_TIMCA|nr:unnamed protein product [Timema californicum]